jgi:hypothetical protein
MNVENIVKKCIKKIKNNNPFKAHILYRKVKILKQLKNPGNGRRVNGTY